jgi:hypothetical protein
MGPSLIWWKASIPWLVAMSVWANVAGHFASWMGARSEAAQTDTVPPRPSVRRPRLDVGRRHSMRAWRKGAGGTCTVTMGRGNAGRPLCGRTGPGMGTYAQGGVDHHIQPMT